MAKFEVLLFAPAVVSCRVYINAKDKDEAIAKALENANRDRYSGKYWETHFPENTEGRIQCDNCEELSEDEAVHFPDDDYDDDEDGE